MKKLFLIVALAGFALCFQPIASGFLTSPAFAATKAQKKKARAVCRKKYGKRYTKTVFSKNGSRYTCYYRKARSAKPVPKNREGITEWCKKAYKGYGEGIRAIKKGGKWYCQYRY